VTLTHNADLSAQWKFLGRGGTIKRDNRPCHCCSITDEDLLAPNLHPCRLCIAMGHMERDPGFLCFHREMLTQDKIADMEQEASAVLQTMAGDATELENILGKSKLRIGEDPRTPTAEAELDSNSIHFNVSVPLDTDSTDFRMRQGERVQYAIKIGEDLESRDMDFHTGSLVERQQRLKTRLICEWTYLQCAESIQQGRNRAHQP
jgi:hypothetical protein